LPKNLEVTICTLKKLARHYSNDLYQNICKNTNFNYMRYTIKKQNMLYLDYGQGFMKEVKEQTSSCPDS